MTAVLLHSLKFSSKRGVKIFYEINFYEDVANKN